ncbi:MAG: segregation/condensation protein A [Candidatus Pacearchaeota archaeon]
MEKGPEENPKQSNDDIEMPRLESQEQPEKNQKPETNSEEKPENSEESQKRTVGQEESGSTKNQRFLASPPEQTQKRSVGQEQVQDILFNREIGWQEIIYDLINTEQLDPWDVDIGVLADRYLEKIRDLEEADFFISSKVLLAASLLLRIKSELLLSKYLKSIDEVLFGKKEEKKERKYEEKVDIDENQVPKLIPKSPVPRMKKVTLNDLMQSLNKAIDTENRRIKKEIVKKNAVRESAVSMPKKKKPGIKDKIKEIFSSLKWSFSKIKGEKKVHYEEVAGKEKENKIFSLNPVLHLEHQREVWVEQEKPLGNVHIWDIEDYKQRHGDPVQNLHKAFEEEQAQMKESVGKSEESYSGKKKSKKRSSDKKTTKKGPKKKSSKETSPENDEQRENSEKESSE